MTWTPDSILALAPDASSAAAGKGLASARKWVSLGRDENAIWGECQGSGKVPYRAQIEPLEPAFKCSCPSRKFPCKHALGLFLLSAQPGVVRKAVAPSWVSEWLASRAGRAEKRAAKKSEPGAPVDTAAQAKRAADRAAKVSAGLEELSLWAKDLVRGGLAAAQARDHGFWETPAARMEDAQAKFVAERVRDLAGLPGGGDGWPDRLLDRLARLHLLAAGFARIDALAPSTQADVRALIGWTLKEEEVRATGEVVRDRWRALGTKVDVEDNRRSGRTWLRGEASGRCAVLLAFAYGAALLEPGPPVGTVIEADLAFYPGANPFRATIKQRHPAGLKDAGGYPNEVDGFPKDAGAFPTLTAATAAFANHLAANPWTDAFPMPLESVTPVRRGDRWAICDEDERVLPLSAGFASGWELRALSGDRPIALFGEFDGEVILPMTVWADGRCVSL